MRTFNSFQELTAHEADYLLRIADAHTRLGAEADNLGLLDEERRLLDTGRKMADLVFRELAIKDAYTKGDVAAQMENDKLLDRASEIAGNG